MQVILVVVRDQINEGPKDIYVDTEVENYVHNVTAHYIHSYLRRYICVGQLDTDVHSRK